MDDAELFWELNEAIRTDPDAPVFEQEFDPTDPVAIEIVMHEADFVIEGYMEKWTSYRDKFSDPSVYESFILAYQIRVRQDLKGIIAQAQAFLADALEPDEESEEEGT